MKVREIKEDKNFLLVTSSTDYLDKEIQGLYCCDLLSWVMSQGKQGNAWITVQTHINIIAVATLIEISCIIIPEGIEIDHDTIQKANEENIPIFKTSLNSFEIFKVLYEKGLR